jgi:hypothetical protein
MRAEYGYFTNTLDERKGMLYMDSEEYDSALIDKSARRPSKSAAQHIYAWNIL